MESRFNRTLENTATFGVLFTTETIVMSLADAIRDPGVDNIPDHVAIYAGIAVAGIFTTLIDQCLERLNR